MYNIKKQETWYGKYHSNIGDIIVIYDQRIAPENPSRIYLYHTQRDKFVEYVEKIISTKLFDLQSEEALQAEKDYKQKWLNAITKQGMVVQKKSKKAKTPSINKDKINWNNSNF